jgi:7,8-dihydropterin-6-yl-methyl-4-(beta-D-ribofuranosyl)aminobenzene 5'-phosphate synthase
MVCDNAVDMLLLDQGPARRLGIGAMGAAPKVAAPTLAGGQAVDAPLAQHGFSALVTVRRGDRTYRVLFDTGMTPNGCVENLRRLDVNPADIDVLVLSHGHFDHTTGLSGLIGTLGRTSLPIVLHPEFWTRRRLAIPGGDPVEIPSTSRQAVQEAGFEIVEARQPSLLLDRALLVTGEVDRTTDFERGVPIHQAWRGGSWQPDPLILDDQALVVYVRDKGLVVLTGCGHAGVVNLLRYARRLTGVAQVHAVLGGFHLGGPLFEPVIPPTVSGLAELLPAVVVPAHCTGQRATSAIAAALPGAFIQNSVGTTFKL